MLLRRQFATLLDMEVLVATTYNLEGDGLAVMLAYERIEALRQLGRSVDQPGILVNLAALLRSSTCSGTAQTVTVVLVRPGAGDGIPTRLPTTTQIK